MIHVLFVCLGNICRSPMAEAVFLHMVREAGLTDKIEVDSAGTGDWHIGSLPHKGTRAVLKKNNVSFDSRARQVKIEDLNDFDFIVTMDDTVNSDVLALSHEAPRARVAQLLDFVPSLAEKNVPDPYFTGDFDTVYTLVHEGCARLLKHIQRESNL